MSLSNKWCSYLDLGECTCVTAGAVVRSPISTLVAGVVTAMALPLHGVAPGLAADDTASIINEPAGGNVVHKEHAQ